MRRLLTAGLLLVMMVVLAASTYQPDSYLSGWDTYTRVGGSQGTSFRASASAGASVPQQEGGATYVLLKARAKLDSPSQVGIDFWDGSWSVLVDTAAQAAAATNIQHDSVDTLIANGDTLFYRAIAYIDSAPVDTVSRFLVINVPDVVVPALGSFSIASWDSLGDGGALQIDVIGGANEPCNYLIRYGRTPAEMFESAGTLVTAAADTLNETVDTGIAPYGGPHGEPLYASVVAIDLAGNEGSAASGWIAVYQDEAITPPDILAFDFTYDVDGDDIAFTSYGTASIEHFYVEQELRYWVADPGSWSAEWGSGGTTETAFSTLDGPTWTVNVLEEGLAAIMVLDADSVAVRTRIGDLQENWSEWAYVQRLYEVSAPPEIETFAIARLDSVTGSGRTLVTGVVSGTFDRVATNIEHSSRAYTSGSWTEWSGATSTEINASVFSLTHESTWMTNELESGVDSLAVRVRGENDEGFGEWVDAQALFSRPFTGHNYWLPDWVEQAEHAGLVAHGSGLIGEVDGRWAITYYPRWYDLQPTASGQYDFSTFDQAISNAQAGGYGLQVNLLSGEYAYLPEWFINDYDLPQIGVGTRIYAPVWREEVRHEFEALIDTLGARYADAPEIMGWYVMAISTSQGEELFFQSQAHADSVYSAGCTPDTLVAWIGDRMDAFAEAFGDSVSKLMWVGDIESNRYITLPGGESGTTWSEASSILGHKAEALGMGWRKGNIERIWNNIGWASQADTSWGQKVIAGTAGEWDHRHGYLTVDETIHPIANRHVYFGEENEEYGSGWVSRFGPLEHHPIRYELAMMRAMQMRMKWLWVTATGVAQNEPLTEYTRLSLGKLWDDSPDAFARLCSAPASYYYVGGQNVAGIDDINGLHYVKNLERYLVQRDVPASEGVPGGYTVPTDKTNRIYSSFTLSGALDVSAHYYDWLARRTDVASDNTHMYFRVDDRWTADDRLMRLYVTYRDTGEGRWRVEYTGESGADSTSWVYNSDSGQVLTTSFDLEGMVFSGAFADTFGMDFAIVAEDGDVEVRLVRLVRWLDKDGSESSKIALNYVSAFADSAYVEISEQDEVVVNVYATAASAPFGLEVGWRHYTDGAWVPASWDDVEHTGLSSIDTEFYHQFPTGIATDELASGVDSLAARVRANPDTSDARAWLWSEWIEDQVLYVREQPTVYSIDLAGYSIDEADSVRVYADVSVSPNAAFCVTYQVDDGPESTPICTAATDSLYVFWDQIDSHASLGGQTVFIFVYNAADSLVASDDFVIEGSGGPGAPGDFTSTVYPGTPPVPPPGQPGDFSSTVMPAALPD